MRNIYFLNDLLKEIDLFQIWANKNDRNKSYGEWEIDYSYWNKIYQNFCKVLDDYNPNILNKKMINKFIYIIARDNESEILIDQLATNKEWFMFLCEYSLKNNDYNARWQFASRLGLFPNLEKSKKYVIEFINDENEYVSRRALLQLPYLVPEKVEYYSDLFWEKETETQEYYRIAILTILKSINSSKLDVYLKKSIEDGRKYVVNCANKIISEKTQNM